ncbi:MAG: Asp-tRNA(Asn)/Glu-tRNA(Gln) amidotransferase subunit GatA [Candidatus Krumholzibacteriota bacterium]
MELNRMSIKELKDLYRRGEAKPADAVRACLERIEEKDEVIGAFLRTFPDEAMKRAKRLEEEGFRDLPMWGVPVAVKDNICTRGQETTAGSRILEGYLPPYSATVVDRLKEAGAIIIGKTNMDEFAMGSSTENSAYRNTANPWNELCAPGGSSGGSAAAVAAGMAAVALGSDTGGSIRQPASLCGIAGLKGTYGRVSRYGLIAFASSLDQIGPMTATVKDSAITLGVIGGKDPRDATTIPEEPEDYISEIDKGIKGFRVAVPRGLDRYEIEPEIAAILRETEKELAASGAEITEVELPDLDASIACYYVLANAEASSNLARYDGVKYGFRADSDTLDEMYKRTRGGGFGDEVKRRILLGTYVLSAGYYDAYYNKAQEVRGMICGMFEEIFAEYDLVMLPTAPGGAFRIGEKIDDPVQMYLSDIFTTPVNIAGLPGISVPAGLNEKGLPLGIQLIAGYGQESKLLRGAAHLEKMYGFDSNPEG